MRRKSRPKEKCRWTSQADALAEFAGFTGLTQSARHIKPLHWYVACRLVVEGGFHPEDITPRPPFRIERPSERGAAPVLHHDPQVAGHGERTILGGLKTKNVDVVVTREGIGPVLAVSCKGVTRAFRNLTNRMEETIGECTNLHITYPALVLGYLVLLRANQQLPDTPDAADSVEEEDLLAETSAEPDTDAEGAEPDETGRALAANDVALNREGRPVLGIVRFHDALKELAGRRGIRNDVSRYEAIACGLVSMSGSDRGSLIDSFPHAESPLRVERFFKTMYEQYDERYVIRAPDLARGTRRFAWAAHSPGRSLPGLDYEARVAASS